MNFFENKKTKKFHTPLDLPKDFKVLERVGPYTKNEVKNEDLTPEQISLKEKITAELENIDFYLLHDIFTKILKSCGVNPDTVFLPEAKDILFQNIKKNVNAVSYSFLDFKRKEKKDSIYFNLNEEALEKLSQAEGFKILKIIIHEIVHQIQSVYVSSDNVIYGLSIKNILSKDISFDNINEGLVEIISDDIFEEYCNTKGFSKQKPSQNYDSEKYFLNLIIESISEESELPINVVKNSFVRASFTGQSIISPELWDLYGDDLKAFLATGIKNSNSKSFFTKIAEFLKS